MTAFDSRVSVGESRSPGYAARAAVPFDIAAMEAAPGAPIIWPIDPRRLQAVSKAQVAGLMQAAALLEGEARDAAIAALPFIRARASALAAAAVEVDAESRSGIRLVGGPPELVYLRGETGHDGRQMTPVRILPPTPQIRLRSLRRMARMLSWTPLHGFPASLISPQGTVVSHNSLLCQYARERGARLDFEHAPTLLGRIVQAAEKLNTTVDIAEIARTLSDALCEPVDVDAEISARLRPLVVDGAVGCVGRPEKDVSLVREWKPPPTSLWSGTGGYYPARVLGLEVLRRGGKVTRFAHGGGAGIVDSAEPLA